MTDQTHRGDAPPALDPARAQARRTRSARGGARGRPGRSVVVGAAALGIVAAAAASWGAVTFLGEFGKPRRGEIVTGRVDYPDLKDGVPALMAPKGPIRVIGTATSASPAQEVAATTAPPVDNRALAALAGGGAVPRPAAIMPATPQAARPIPSPAATASIAPPALPRVETPKAAPPFAIATTAVVPVPPASRPIPSPTTTASIPSPTPFRAETAKPASVVAVAPPPAAPPHPTASLLPLPTPRPATPAMRTASRAPDTLRAADAPREAAPSRLAEPMRIAPTAAGAAVASSRPPRATAPRATPVPAAPAPEPQGVEDDHVNVFGLAVPTIGATGRRIKESVEALGDAVSRL